MESSYARSSRPRGVLSFRFRPVPTMIAACRPPVVLVVLDGWGLSPERDHNAIALGRTPRLRGASRSFSARVARHERRSRRPAGRTDGQLRGRPHESRRGPRDLPGPLADRREHSGRRLLHEPGAGRRHEPLRRRSARPAPGGAGLPRGRPQPLAAPRSACRAGAAPADRAAVRPRVHRRTRHRAHRRGPATWRRSSERWRTRAWDASRP